MTPQERQLVDDLFDRLEKLENAPRDNEAETTIVEGLRRAPHAVYALVQTALIQDEALKRASARIEELEGNAPEQRPAGGFLDSMRDTVLGPSRSRGSVPEVQTNEQRGPIWNAGQQADPRMNADPRSSGSGGGSFLGTAAAAAAGVIGGSMLMNSIRGLMGGGGHQGFGDTALAGDNKSPWGGDKSNNDLARDAGINDIGKGDRDNDTRQNFAHENLDENSDENSDDAQFNGSDEDNGLDADDFDSDDFGSDDSDFA